MSSSNDLREGAKEVARLLQKHGFEAYLAGGCVRDLLLGQEPKDYDVVTDAVPEQVSRLFKRTVEVGASFGVVRVLWTRGRDYEVATYRTEGAYTDGRRPDEVAYSRSKEEDVARRDFTINALLMEIDGERILDFVGGQNDLAARVIRAVGDPVRRFAEDKLRMLRAVRFASRLGFEIEPATRAAIAAHAADLRQVSVERIVMELHSIWAGPRPGQAFRELVELGLAAVIFPFLSVEREGPTLALAFDRLPEAAARRDLIGASRTPICWAALLERRHSGEDPERVLRALRLSRDEIRNVLQLLERRPLLLDPASAPLAERRRLLRDGAIASHLAFLEVLTGPGSAALEAWAHEAEALALADLPDEPLLGGADLKALGVAPGPEYKELLRAVEDEMLEGRLSSREAALEWVSERRRRNATP